MPLRLIAPLMFVCAFVCLVPYSQARMVVKPDEAVSITQSQAKNWPGGEGLNRWLSEDPIGEEGGINLYAYVENRPVDLLDFLGLEPPSSDFWNGYPNYSQGAPDVWKSIGGWIGDKFGPKSNSCAARVSVGLNQSGEPIKPGGAANKNTDGKRYILSAEQLQNYLAKQWGKPDATIKTREEADALKAKLKPDQVAVVCSTKHAGVIKEGYSDPYIPIGPTKVWILPAK